MPASRRKPAGKTLPLENNTFRIADLVFPMVGRLSGYIDRGTAAWSIELATTVDCENRDGDEDENGGRPFGANLIANGVPELNSAGFNPASREFLHRLQGSDSFAFNPGGESSFIGPIDYVLRREPSMPPGWMHFHFRDRLDLMICPGYMEDIDCGLSVDVEFTHFEYSSPVSPEGDVEDIKRITGVEEPLEFVERHPYGHVVYKVLWRNPGGGA